MTADNLKSSRLPSSVEFEIIGGRIVADQKALAEMARLARSTTLDSASSTLGVSTAQLRAALTADGRTSQNAWGKGKPGARDVRLTVAMVRRIRANVEGLDYAGMAKALGVSVKAVREAAEFVSYRGVK